MSLNRKQATDVVKTEQEGSKIVHENLTIGENEGRLALVADLGLQARSYMGEFKGNFQQIALGIEMVGQPIKTEDGEVLPRILFTKPFYIYDKMGEKSKEFEYYSKFDPMAVAESVPDWDAQIGKPVTVVVEHNKGKGEKAGEVYDNIKALVGIPAKYQAGVEAGTVQGGVSDSDNPNDPLHERLYGLAKHVFDKRINQSAQRTQSGPNIIENSSFEQSSTGFDDFDDLPFEE